VRQLLPEPLDEADPVPLYASDTRPCNGPRPWVLIDMIASIDGATAVEGRSARLGGPADRAVFHAIRAVADVILVAAGTARAEHYRAPRLDDRLVTMRRNRGQADQPRLAIVSRQLDLHEGVPALHDPTARPLVITTANSPADRRSALSERADILTHGTNGVDVTAALEALRRTYGAEIVVAEGGPIFNAVLAAADAIDEVCLTLAPTLVGGSSARVIHGGHPIASPFDLVRVLEEDGYLFLRYSRRPHA
jgi:riboflavin-specific deaminase-like protein